jgi:hypothetical protein
MFASVLAERSRCPVCFFCHREQDARRKRRPIKVFKEEQAEGYPVQPIARICDELHHTFVFVRAARYGESGFVNPSASAPRDCYAVKCRLVASAAFRFGYEHRPPETKALDYL